jgi:putative DNA-invertase from lambdoid prophage Rac
MVRGFFVLAVTLIEPRLVRTMLDEQQGVSVIAKVADLSRQTIYRIEQDPAGAEAALAMWGE